VDIYWNDFSTGSASLSCEVSKQGGSHVAWGKVSRPNGATVRCVFSTSGFRPTKGIHWRSQSSSLNGTDKAPDAGWVVGVA
jgi:hypothetical protein